jgi:hypothetical protein
VIIPDLVASELAAASNPIISAILQLGWIQTQPFTNPQLADQLQQDCNKAVKLIWVWRKSRVLIVQPSCLGVKAN